MHQVVGVQLTQGVGLEAALETPQYAGNCRRREIEREPSNSVPFVDAISNSNELVVTILQCKAILVHGQPGLMSE